MSHGSTVRKGTHRSWGWIKNVELGAPAEQTLGHRPAHLSETQEAKIRFLTHFFLTCFC
jgi:hypothetical protein